MFTPTKEQLIELDFNIKKYAYKWVGNYTIYYNGHHEIPNWTLYNNSEEKINIESLEDIKTLIRLLTPPHEN